MNENSISVIVPALNEEKNLEAAVAMVSEAVKKRFDEYEIIIFNDGSSDRTGEVAEALAKRDKHLKVIHHKNSKCLGGVYKEGRALAKMNYLIFVNGKGDIPSESFDAILAQRGKADIIIPYTLNSKDRPIHRRVISQIFVWLLNTIFKLNLRYYNHSVLHKKEIVDSVDIFTNSYAFQAEILIKLIKSGYSYIEVGISDKFEKGIKTKIFKLKNIISTGLFLINIISEIYFSKKYRNKRESILDKVR